MAELHGSELTAILDGIVNPDAVPAPAEHGGEFGEAIPVGSAFQQVAAGMTKMAKQQALAACRGVQGPLQPAGRVIVRYAPDSEVLVVDSQTGKALRPYAGAERRSTRPAPAASRCESAPPGSPPRPPGDRGAGSVPARRIHRKESA